MARDTLREWQDKNHPWLELTDIHRETTENIRVTVMPFYIGSRVSIVRLMSASVCLSRSAIGHSVNQSVYLLVHISVVLNVES